MAHEIPPKFKVPEMKSYDGTKDPVEHVETYESLMELNNAMEDYLKC